MANKLEDKKDKTKRDEIQVLITKHVKGGGNILVFFEKEMSQIDALKMQK